METEPASAEQFEEVARRVWEGDRYSSEDFLALWGWARSKQFDIAFDARHVLAHAAGAYFVRTEDPKGWTLWYAQSAPRFGGYRRPTDADRTLCARVYVGLAADFPGWDLARPFHMLRDLPPRRPSPLLGRKLGPRGRTEKPPSE